MGAFILYQKKQVNNMEPALDMFAEMGFFSPQIINVNDWKLYVFPKMTANKPGIFSMDNCTIICIGTSIYKGLDYSESLNALLKDYLTQKVNYEQLIGQYTILFCRDNTIEILCDPMGCKHLFTNHNHSIISSHMLPLCQCINTKLHINKKAFYEKFLTGIIMSPNTLFEEIIQIDRQIAQRINKEDKGIKFIGTNTTIACGPSSKSFKNGIAEQAGVLREYFVHLNNAAKTGIDIGLSGGYDSRLVLACLHNYTKGQIHLHSHSTENVHQTDLSVAKQMADYVGIPCHIVETRKLCHSINIDEILRKSILYFDGRSSFSIGGCGEVYTALYRKKSTENIPFTITGVGGELYRNVFDVGFRNIRFDRFMEEKVFSQNFRKAISTRLYNEIKDDIILRAASRLSIDPRQKQSKTIAHRYYCEIMMPDGQGVAVDAYNQVSCCIAPFLESKVIEKGYEAIPFHHSGGEFEGKLIEFIDPKLSTIPSTYGYPIGKRPILAKVKERIRTLIPIGIWNRLSLVFHNNVNAYSFEAALDELYANSQTIKNAYAFLHELFPEIDYKSLLCSSEDIRRTQFIAMTLYELRERITVN